MTPPTHGMLESAASMKRAFLERLARANAMSASSISPRTETCLRLAGEARVDRCSQVLEEELL